MELRILKFLEEEFPKNFKIIFILEKVLEKPLELDEYL